MGLAVSKRENPSLLKNSFFNIKQPAVAPSSPLLTEAKQFLQHILPFQLTPDATRNRKELIAHIDQLVIIYKALCAQFNDAVARGTELASLQVLHYALVHVSGLIATTYKEHLNQITHGNQWIETQKNLQAMDANKLTSLRIASPPQISFVERIKTSVKKTADSFASFVKSPIDSIRNFLAETNWWRLFSDRFFGFVNRVSPLTKSTKVNKVSRILRLLSKPFSIFGIGIYTLRLMLNFGAMFKHAGSGLTDKEKKNAHWDELSWQEKVKLWWEKFKEVFSAEWKNRKFIIANDFFWSLVNILCLVALTTTVGAYVAVGFYFFDILNAGLQLYEMHQENKHMLQTLDQHITEDTLTPTPTREHTLCHQLLEQHRNYVHAQVKHDERAQKITIGVNSTLFGGAIAGLAVLTPVWPLIPVVGAVILFTAMAADRILNWLFNRHAPASQLASFTPTEQSKSGHDLTYKKVMRSVSAPTLGKQVTPAPVVVTKPASNNTLKPLPTIKSDDLSYRPPHQPISHPVAASPTYRSR